MSYIQSNVPILVPNVGTPIAVSASDSGKIFYLGRDPAPVAKVVNIPAPTTAGLKYDFIMQGTAAANATVTITSTAANIKGLWRQISGAATVAGPSTSITFTATSIPGDRVTLVSDGTSWMCEVGCVMQALVLLQGLPSRRWFVESCLTN